MAAAVRKGHSPPWTGELEEVMLGRHPPVGADLRVCPCIQGGQTGPPRQGRCLLPGFY